jgi:polyisoprenoid-binding protein YceI
VFKHQTIILMQSFFKSALLSLLALVLSVPAMAQMSAESTWSFDQSHSKVGFAVTHLVISEVEGQFHTYEGTVTTTSDDFSGASIVFSADISSIDTENEKRDGHLQSPDFFDAATYPKMTFKSTSFKKKKGNKYELKGDLTIRDVTKPITLDVTYGGTVQDPYGNTKAGFKLTGAIDRFEYGLKWDAATEAGNLVVSREVDLEMNIQLAKAK